MMHSRHHIIMPYSKVMVAWSVDPVMQIQSFAYVQNVLEFLRLRSMKYEILVAPRTFHCYKL
jgi:hypothetical protein